MWWHDAIIDEMIAHPELSKKDIAARLRCTPQFIYMITTSDLFQARFSQRRAEYEQQLGLGIVGKVAGVADKTLDLILETLEVKGTAVPLPQLESLADKTLGRLGYGIAKQTAPQAIVNVNGASDVQVIVPVTQAELEAARQLIRNNERELVNRTIENRAAGLERVTASAFVEGAPVIEGEVVDSQRDPPNT